MAAPRLYGRTLGDVHCRCALGASTAAGLLGRAWASELNRDAGSFGRAGRLGAGAEAAAAVLTPGGEPEHATAAAVAGGRLSLEVLQQVQQCEAWQVVPAAAVRLVLRRVPVCAPLHAAPTLAHDYFSKEVAVL